jgi:hypothetical protein
MLGYGAEARDGGGGSKPKNYHNRDSLGTMATFV